VTARVLASWEPSWSDDGAWLGAPAVHLEALEGDPLCAVEALVGAGLCARLDPKVTRLDPSVSLATLAALLRARGWQVEEGGPDGLVASR
jgi:hypothetical protein